MTDNMCEIETVAIAHRACSADDSGILLTDFACAYSSADHKTRALPEKTHFEESVVLGVQEKEMFKKSCDLKVKHLEQQEASMQTGLEKTKKYSAWVDKLVW